MALTVVKIALSGKMRSGKDTVADYLEMHHGFLRLAFADKLKEVAMDLFGMTGKNRALLQAFGWRMCQIDRAVWVKHVLDKIPLARSVVVSDLRFPIEYNALRALGFCMVRIEVDSETQMFRVMQSEHNMPTEDVNALLKDVSEIALDEGFEWDYVINGGADRDCVYKDVGMMVAKFKEIRRS